MSHWKRQRLAQLSVKLAARLGLEPSVQDVRALKDESMGIRRRPLKPANKRQKRNTK